MSTQPDKTEPTLTAEQFLTEQFGKNPPPALDAHLAREFAGKSGLGDVVTAHILLMTAAAMQVERGEASYSIKNGSLVLVPRKEQ